MSPVRWQDIILGQIGHEQNQSVVVVDPDRLMQDDVLISELQARGYDILNFSSEIAFRNEFEERYRSRWDQGEKTHIVVIVHSSEASRHLPYDLEKKSRVVEIGLHQVFPRLNRIVLAGLDRRYYPALFQAHATLERDNRTATTERETIRFILRGVFGIDPVALKSPERLAVMLIDKHYAAQAIPPALERYVVEEMRTPLPGNPDPATLFSHADVFYDWLGQRWAEYVQSTLQLLTSNFQPPTSNPTTPWTFPTTGCAFTWMACSPSGYWLPIPSLWVKWKWQRTCPRSSAGYEPA